MGTDGWVVMEELLALKAAAFDGLLQHYPTGVAILNNDLQYLVINQRLADFNGLTIEAHLGRSVAEVLPQLYPQLATLLDNTIKTGEPQLHFSLGNSPEQQHWHGSYIPLFDANQQVQGILVLAVNETVEQRVQRQSQLDLQRSKQVLNHLFAFAGVLDPAGILLDANNPPLEQAGLELSDVLHRPFWQCYWWSHDSRVADQIRTAIELAQQGQTSRFDTTALMKHGVIDIDFMLAPMLDESGKLLYLIPSGIEITERKKSQRGLADSELRFRRVFDSTADGLISVDRQGHITLANARAQEMFGYSQEEMVGQSIEILVPADHTQVHRHHRQHYLQAPQTRAMAQRQELFARRKNGSLFPVEIGLTYLKDDPVVSVVATVTDVTLAREIQQNLQSSVQEKTTLLGERTALLNEVHHRVKNNLQVISSLLNLQARKATSETSQALTISQLRVRTMALTHQLLYENKNFSSVPFGSYLTQLCHLLGSSLINNPGVRFEFPGLEQDLVLSLERTIPCGLLVNEIITNSLKHAFPDGKAGVISLSVRRSTANECELTITDNGIGLPDNVEPGQGDSMGMQLIPAFVAQLGARYQLQRQGGTCYQFWFTLE